MRQNATGHNVGAVADLQNTVAQMNRCARLYIARINEHVNLTPGERTKLSNGLVAQGVTGVGAAIVQLQNAAVALRDASKNDLAEVTAANDALLASVTRYSRIRG